MHSPGSNSRTKRHLNISDAGLRFGSTKLAAAAIRGALALFVLSALLLMAARPTQAQSGPYGIVSPTTRNFRGAVGQTSPPQTVILKNTGDSQLTVSNISVSPGFAISTNRCANGVRPGTHCNVWVTFTPTGPGTVTGTLTFVDNASNSPQTVALTGRIGETVLYNFTGGSDGGWPGAGLVSDGAGNFYGMTYPTGVGNGTVFEVSPNGSGGWNHTVIHNFTCGADGGWPTFNSLVFDSAGNLYGTTPGCIGGWGDVFKLSPVGTTWNESVLYSFTGSPDGATPNSGLIMDPAGNLYGTTVYGGTFGTYLGGFGTVFELSPSGGGWTERVIYNVPACCMSYAGLTMDSAGNIFGATSLMVFELSPNGDGGWNPTVIHSFHPGGPYASGTPVLDKAGNLYGTTFDQYTGGGAVYKLTHGTNRTWTETILHSFGSGKDGSGPWAGLTFDAAGNIYGTTAFGGYYGKGTVFELAVQIGTGGYKEKVLWSFNGPDGATPYNSVPILDSAGNVYGTTVEGGSQDNGVVFEVTP
jgi:uncharacterized repeat protein (TIGR03803 family)